MVSHIMRLVDVVRDEDLTTVKRLKELDYYFNENEMHDDNEIGEALHAAALNNDVDVVFYLLEKRPDAVEYKNQYGMNVLAIAYCRGRDFFDFILQKSTDNYFLQYLLCKHYFQVKASNALDYFVTEFKATYKDDFRYSWSEAKRQKLDEKLKPALHFVAQYYEEYHKLYIFEILNELSDDQIVRVRNTQLINQVYKFTERVSEKTDFENDIGYVHHYLNENFNKRSHRINKENQFRDIMIELRRKDDDEGLDFVKVFFTMIKFRVEPDDLEYLFRNFELAEVKIDLIQNNMQSEKPLFKAAVDCFQGTVNYLTHNTLIAKVVGYIQAVSKILQSDQINIMFQRFLFETGLRQNFIEKKNPSITLKEQSSKTETLMVNLFRGRKGTFSILRNTRGEYALKQDGMSETDISTDVWNFSKGIGCQLYATLVRFK